MSAVCPNDRCGSWPCSEGPRPESRDEVSQAAIAVISGLIPTMFMTRVRF
jgi:hypothetical protein